MENFNFEKQISEKLANAQEQPSTDLFNSIMQKRNQKAKPNIPVFYKYGILAFVGIVAFATYYFYPNNNNNLSENPIVSQISEDNLEYNASNIEKSEFNNVNSQSQLVDNKMVKEKISDLKNSKVINQTEKGSSKNLIKENPNKNYFTKNEKNEGKSKVSLTSNISKNTMSNLETNSTKDVNNNPFENYFNPESKNRPEIEQYTNKGNSHLYVYNNFGDYDVDFSSLNFLTKFKLDKIKLKQVPKDELYAKSYKYRNFVMKQKRPVFIDIMVTPMLTSHRVLAGFNTSSFYNNFEKITPNYFVEGRVTIPIKNNFSIYTGISFGSLNTHYNGRFTHQENVTENIDREIFINDPITGQSRKEIVSEEINYDKYTVFQNDFTNTTSLNQIPLGLGYNFGFKKFDFATNGGLLLNIINKSNGKDLKFMNENSFGYGNSKTTFGFGYSFGVMAAYNVSRKIKYFIEPTISSFNLDNINYGSLYQQKITNLGLKLGVRYNLN